MKLLFFISSLRGGGAERVMTVLCNELVQRGHEVYLATNINIPFAYNIDSRVKLINLFRDSSEDSNLFVKLKNKFNLFQRIRSITREVQPHSIISFMLNLNADVLLATIGLKVPVIVSEHSTFDTKLSRLRYFKRFYINRLAKYVTVLTNYDFEFIGDKLKNKIVMPNPLSFEINTSNNRVREKVVLAVGSVDRWEGKGFDSLMKIWGRISSDFPDWKLQIAGDGKSESFEILKNLARQNNIEHSIDFLGFQKELDILLQQKSIFVLASRFEGLPMVLIESMSQGCVSVAFDCIAGPREILTHDESGLLIENQNMEEMERALSLLMSDDILRFRLSKGGMKEAKRFSTDKIIDMWEEVLNKVNIR